MTDPSEVTQPELQDIKTAPESGKFLIGVWEGSWKNPRRSFHVYEAWAGEYGPTWAKELSYRTEEGEAYEVAGWAPRPRTPSKSRNPK